MENKTRIVKTVCTICPCACGMVIFEENGEIKKVEGDLESPISKGFLCEKGIAIIEYITHKDRILYPMKRKGKRGEGEWERISWDEALDCVASQMRSVASLYGAESVAFLRGAAKGLADILLTRLANAFGSPNITSMGFLCFVPRVYAYNATFGSFLYPDYDHPPSTIVLWGINPSETFPPLFQKILEAKEKGSKIIVIDPRKSESSKIADLWIRPRPSLDIAFALSVIHEIIKQELYDREFVEEWTEGFEELKRHSERFDPKDMEKFTWVSEKEVKDFVRIYTENRPSAIQEGNGIEQSLYTFQTQRAIYILEAITGNIGIPGGKIRWKNPRIIEKYGAKFTLQDNIPQEKREKRLGAEFLAPFAHYALPQAIVKSLVNNVKERPRAALIMGGNILLSWPDSKMVLEALSALDFICVVDHFHTPTAQMADILLPAATFLEFDSIHLPPDFTYIAHVQNKVCQKGESKSDIWIINELGKRLGLGKYFFSDEYALFDEILKDDGLTFTEFKKIGILIGKKEYRFYEKEGFRTDSKKVEIFSRRLKALGFDPLPNIGLTTFCEEKDYPFVLTTYKPSSFRHTNLRHIDSLRRNHPDPYVFLNEEKARELGIEENNWIKIESKNGMVRAKVKIDSDISERLVILEHGWWFPEKDWKTFLDVGINSLTCGEPPFSRETGTPILRGLPCKISKL